MIRSSVIRPLLVINLRLKRDYRLAVAREYEIEILQWGSNGPIEHDRPSVLKLKKKSGKNYNNLVDINFNH